MGARTCTQQGGTTCKNGYIVIKGRPCRVVEVSTSETREHGRACHFVGIDIFTGKKYEVTVPSSNNCDVPNVDRKDYPVIGISDGYVSVSGANGTRKDDLRLPDGDLGAQLIRHFDDEKKLAMSAVSAMEEQNIIAFREVSK